MENLIKGYGEFLLGVRGLSSKTVISYLRHVRDFESWLRASGGDDAPDVDVLPSASQVDIEAWLKYLFFSRKLGNPTRASMLSAIKNFYSYLVHERILTGSPAEKVPTPRFRPNNPRKFSSEQLHLIFSGPDAAILDGIRDFALLVLLYGAGPRVSEVSALTISQLLFTPASCTIVFHGKGARERTVKLVEFPARALFAWYSVRISQGAVPDAPLFTSLQRDVKRQGLAMSAKALNEVLKKYAHRVGIDEAEAFVHKMRSTFATDLYDLTKDILVVAAKMGHDDVKTTQKYVAISNTALKKGIITAGRWKELMRGGIDE